MTEPTNTSELDIAVIGLAGRFPGADNISQYWRNLAEGVESIESLTDEELLAAGVEQALIDNPKYVKAASVLDAADMFDAEFFGYSPKEAALMDPQGRVFLECAWQAMEDAGHSGESFEGSVGVWASQSAPTYLLYNLGGGFDFRDFVLGGRNIQTMLGNGDDFLATRVSFRLNLTGPSMRVQTACSSSLVGIHLARQSLLNGECDMALAGGVSIYQPQGVGYLHEDGLILSPDGHCRPFDAAASGTVFGRGVGVVVLRRLEDAIADGDHIRAVIRGSALNNDGSSKVGYAAPSVRGQSRVIAEALADADLSADDISYVEAHGTGTPQGDPVELAALTQAFRRTSSRTGFCSLGSVKSNIGHTDVAAGVASFIKVVSMLEQRKIPPSLHFEHANPEIDFKSSPFTVATQLTDWVSTDGEPLRAGVSGFGIGGTNAHLILEQVPVVSRRQQTLERGMHVLTLSARNASALERLVGRYAEALSDRFTHEAGDVCFTANAGRVHFSHRLVVVGRSTEELGKCMREAALGNEVPGVWRGQVERGSEEEKIAFLFTGQGAEYPGVGKELYQTQPTFRAAMDECNALFDTLLDRSLFELLYGGSDDQHRLAEMKYAQPVVFSLEYSLAVLWRSWGIEPSVVTGHSLGEYAAACVAGVFSLEDGLRLVSERGRLLSSVPAAGLMAAVFTDHITVQRIIKPFPNVTVAAVNGPANVVVSGPLAMVESSLEAFAAEEILSRPLKISSAAHSPLVDMILDSFEAVVKTVELREPELPFVSTLTGALTKPGALTSSSYWREHLRSAVLFQPAVDALIEQGVTDFVEIGPHSTLLGMARESVPPSFGHWHPSLRRDRGDWDQMAESVARLYLRGAPLDWAAFDRGYVRRRVPLPTYPFERTRHWIEPGAMSGSQVAGVAQGTHPFLLDRVRSPLIEVTVYAGRVGVAVAPSLGHHRVLGEVIFPLTGYMELALEAARAALGEGYCLLSDIVVVEPLVLSAKEHRDVQVILRPQATGGQHWQVFAAVKDAEDIRWVCHAEGSVCDTSNYPALPGGEVLAPRGSVPPGGPATGASDILPPVLAEVQSRCQQEVDAALYYAKLTEAGIDYGPMFRGISRLWCGDGEALGFIELPRGLVDELSGFIAHPALLDACLQLAMAPFTELSGEPDGMPFLPIGVTACRIEGQLAGPLWSHARAVDRDGDDANRECEVIIRDHNGRMVVQVEGILLRRADPNAWARSAARQVSDWFYEVSWHPAQLPVVEETGGALDAEPLAMSDVNRPGWLVFIDSNDVTSRQVVSSLRERGDRCDLVFAKGESALDDEDAQVLSPERPEDFSALFSGDREVGQSGRYRGILYLWGLTPEAADEPSLDALGATVTCDVVGLLSLVQAMVADSALGDTPLWIVTRGAKRTSMLEAVPGFIHAPLWGLGQVVSLEHPELRCTRVDLDPQPTGRNLELLLAELDVSFEAKGAEDQVAFRGEERLVPRLSRAAPADAGAAMPAQSKELAEGLDVSAFGSSQAYQLKAAPSGSLDQLRLAPAQRVAPGPGEVEIAVVSTGLNFKDVLCALDMYPGEPGPLGSECAGMIVRTGEGVDRLQRGDRVLAFARGAFSSFVNVPAELAVAKPSTWSFDTAASLLGAFLTADFALHGCARVGKGDKVLIHSGTGGVGLAAIQLARTAGAEVYATAGSPEKRKFLTQLGVQHVMDSRSVSFGAEVMKLTQGRGVDVVVNSLAGQMIDESLRVTADGGRFVEMGKNDVRTKEQVEALGRGIDYHVIDVEEESRIHPEAIGARIRSLVDRHRAGELTPLPARSFALSEADAAFRQMSQARHIGKLVVRHDGGRHKTAADGVFDPPRGTCLITGGLGGLGLLMARWLVDRGASRIVLMGRRAATPEALAAIAEMEALGARITLEFADLTREEEVRAVLDRIAASGVPLAGVIQAAGVLDDGVLLQQSAERFARVMGAKVQGSWILHRLTMDRDLDYFILFSSIASVLGSPGQSNHAAANAFLDSLAGYRRARGLPALAINWGAWSELGAAAGSNLQQRFSERGLGAISPRLGLRSFELALEQDSPEVTIVAVDWARYPGTKLLDELKLATADAADAADRSNTSKAAWRERIENAPLGQKREVVAEFVRNCIALGLGLPPDAPIDPTRPLSELGVDSLLAVGLRNSLSSSLEMDRILPATLLFDYPSVDELTRYFAREVLQVESESPANTAQKTADADLEEIAELSDEQAEALLLRELDQT
jgi:acyl transferase domain-containing protein/NADPH:quinone reductase-like Zn-dependent oxidoreductase